MKTDDMQVSIPIVGTRDSYIDNAAKATSKGFEIGLNGKITDSLELFGAYGYTNSKFDDYKNEKNDYSGNKNVGTPDYNYNIGIQYRDTQGYFARVDINGNGKMYSDLENTERKDSYTLVNTKIGYETEDYDIYLYGKNIFDKEYHGGKLGGGVIPTPLREIGVQLAYRF